jgi:parvulin-like peptidyl-prolyl isomerase
MNRFTLLLLALFGAAAVSSATRPAAGILIDSYAAIVNGKVITVGDVLAALQPAQERLAALHQGHELEKRLAREYTAVRDALIETELILLDFEAQGGTLPDRAIEDHINSVIHERFDNDRAAFLRALAAERLTFSEWRKQMKDQLIAQIMRQREVSSKILITPFDIQQAYQRNIDAYTRTERVQLRTRPAGADATEALALRDHIRSGETPFEETESPDAPAWFDLSDLNPALRDAIAGLSPGGIADPVDLDGTVYLVQLLDRQDAQVQPLDEVTPAIERDLRRAEFERLHGIWMDALRRKYYVQLFTHSLFQ